MLGPPIVRGSWKDDSESGRRPSPDEKSSSPSDLPHNRKYSPSSSGLHSTSSNPHKRRSPLTDTDQSSEGYTSSESEEVGELSLSRGMKRLTIRGLEPAQEASYLADSQVRFHGKSSWFKLIEPTRKLRDEHVSRVIGGGSTLTQDSTNPVSAAATRRPEFWTTLPVSYRPSAFLSVSSRHAHLHLSGSGNLRTKVRKLGSRACVVPLCSAFPPRILRTSWFGSSFNT